MARWSKDLGRRLARAVLGAMAGLLLAVACAQALAASPRSLRFERIGVVQGLSQESVLNVLQDRQGFMWFGTQAGLNRFDGYRMTVFRNDRDKPDSIPDNFVTASYEDAAGRLWFGTKGGLVRFDPVTQGFVHYQPGAARLAANGNRAVTAIVPDGPGALWLATGIGLQHFDMARGEFTALRHDPADPASLADDRVNALAVDGKGALWVGTASGLDKLPRGERRFEHFVIDENARRNSVLSLSMGPRETLWVGTAAGLEAWRLDEDTPRRRRIGANEGIGAVGITTLYHDAGPNLWVGTDVDGLKWLDPASGRFVSYRNLPLDRHSLSDNRISAIRVDRTGTLWVGSYYGGVNRVDLASGGFARYMDTPGEAGGIGHNRVRAIIGDGAGGLWLGTGGGGLTRFDPDTGSAEYFRHDPKRPGSLPGNVVTALALDGQRLWVGTSVGLFFRDPGSGRFEAVLLAPGTNANNIFALRKTRDGILWVATRGGLFAMGPGNVPLRRWRHDSADPTSLGEDYCYALLEDRRGDIWIGTDNGLERFDRATGKFTHYRHDPADRDSLRHNRVYTLLESSRGQLWAGTAGGLHRVETGADGKVRFQLVRVTNSREPQPIGAVLEDTAGSLWVSTVMGIARVDPVSGAFKTYSPEDGLIDGSYFVGSGYASPDGQLYFGGLNGMTGFTPSAIRDNPYAPTVLITDFRVFNRQLQLRVPVHETRDITLSYRDAGFSLEFAALHFADPHANRYAYRLEGFDQGWVDTDSSMRFATYTNLDPGRYVFRVRASNKDGVWADAPASLAITITPPFWRTWWFRLLAGMLVLGSAYALYRRRVHALVEHKESLEREVFARTAELVLQKEAAERRKQEVEQQKEVVEQAHRNISQLSEIGRKLTANLDTEAISATLYEHVHALMDASVFGIGIHRPERGTITWPFVVLSGERCAAVERAITEPHQLAAWCIANGREVLMGEFDRECRDYLPDSDPQAAAENALPCAQGAASRPQSLLMAPIVLGARVLGVVTVLSFERHAYRQVHVDMLRTLAAYVGVALDNANAYRQLKDTQAQLAAREKLASLGSLVAGVAHELNTPIGNSLLMASTLQEKTESMAASFQAQTLRRSDLERWIASSQEASNLMMRSLNGAAELVNSFRQVAVDQASAQRRRFDLARACHEIAATMMKQVSLAGHTLELAVPPGIVMDSFPGPLGQVVINFINNALLHAFDDTGGRMMLSASTPEPGRVRIEFRDDGRGIEPGHLERIFEPFFTTRMGRGGTGLGLNIAYNIVTTLLGGAIRAESEPGNGTVFIVDLPLALREPAIEQNY